MTGPVRNPLRTRAVLGLLCGTVLIPALLSVSVGIVALALWQEARDVVFGILELVFAAAAIVGASLSLGFLRRSARLAEQQTDFVANASHELRTPAAAIQVLVDALVSGRGEAAGRREEVLSLLDAQTRRLSALVERLLCWKRLENIGLVEEREPHPVVALVDEAVASFSALLIESGTRLRTDVEADLPSVLVNRDATLEALRNVIDNAIKFGGEAGPIDVIARRADVEVTIEVRDRGPGIPDPERERIFERFYRVASHPRSKQGLGLGLAIAQRAVAGQGGRLSLEGPDGDGARFVIRLPIAEVEALG